MNEWLKIFFKNASAEVAAIVLVMGADLLFLYKVLPYRVFYQKDVYILYMLVGLSQAVVLIVVNWLYRLSLLKNERKRYEALLSWTTKSKKLLHKELNK